MDNNNMITIIKEQEKELVFDSFTNEDALNIGNLIVKHISARGKSVAVEITVNGWQVFKYAMNGTSPENDNWMRRKRRMLDYRRTSTLLAQFTIKSKEEKLLEDLYLDPMDYATAGGAFPINLRGTIIGSIIVSGLPDVEDHQTVVDVLNEYLGKNAPSILL